MNSSEKARVSTPGAGQARGNPRSFLLKGLPKNAVCAEIGVWQGNFSNRILEHTQPRELHLIDPWAYSPDYPERWYGGLAAKSQSDMEAIYQGVVQRFAKFGNIFVHRMISEAAGRSFDDSYFDWVYIDGNHSYEYVKQDLEIWLPKVKAGGLVTGDDVYWPGEAGSQPVRRALEDFVKERRIERVMVKNNQFVIRVDDLEA